MDRPHRRRAQWLVLAVIWILGAGGIFAPAEVGDRVRAALRDALRPGHMAIQRVVERARQVSALLRPSHARDDEIALRAELEEWRARALKYQAALAQLGSQEPSHESHTLAGSVLAQKPLLIQELLPATVLGRERDVLRRRFTRILDRGANAGISVDDLVLGGDAPLLDRGTDDGVMPDASVVSGRVVAGRIRLVGRLTSTLQLVTDPEFRGSAQLVRESSAGPVLGATGVLAGNGDGTCRLELVAATWPVSVGDFVYGRDPQSNAPSSMYYGRVIAAELADGAEHWSITVAPAIRPESLHSVQIVQEALNPARLTAAEAITSAGSSGPRTSAFR